MSNQIYKKTYQDECDQLLKYILDKRFFEPLKNPDNYTPIFNDGTSVELYITSECNLKCDYCYLHKHGDKLYPKELRNKDIILDNLDKIMKYFLNNNFHIRQLELFSGEIWGSKFSYSILDTILSYIEKNLDIKFIVIPSNMTFITSDKTTEEIQLYIDEFKKHGVSLIFSASIDGLFIEDLTRAQKDAAKKGLRDEAYYEKVFTFCKKNNFGFHPMISAKNVKYQIENHKWFLQMLKKYEINYGSGIMFLEVRNDDWTEENINDYLNFLDYLIDELRHNFYYSDEEMIADIFRLNPTLISNYNPIGLNCNGNEYSCTIDRTLHIRLGDLSIVPCHRLSYDPFIYGKFKIENNEIVDIESKNFLMAQKVLFNNINLANNGCDSCDYNYFCMKGCLGSQFETTGDPFFCCPSVCNLLKKEIQFLIKKYEKIGFINILETKKNEDSRVADLLENIYKLKEKIKLNE